MKEEELEPEVSELPTGKLVRDLIPEIIRQNGETPVYRRAWPREMPDLLRAKLKEEVAEYFESGDIMELVDILEVIRELAHLEDVSPVKLEMLRQDKAVGRGSFNERWILIEESKDAGAGKR